MAYQERQQSMFGNDHACVFAMSGNIESKTWSKSTYSKVNTVTSAQQNPCEGSISWGQCLKIQ